MSFFWAYVRLSWLPQHDHGVCKSHFFFCFRAWGHPSSYREKISWTPTGAYWTRQEYGCSTHVGKMATQSDVVHFLVGKQVLYQLFHCCSSREVKWWSSQLLVIVCWEHSFQISCFMRATATRRKRRHNQMLIILWWKYMFCISCLMAASPKRENDDPICIWSLSRVNTASMSAVSWLLFPRREMATRSASGLIEISAP